MQTTTNVVPQSNALLTQSKLPLGAIFSPMAQPQRPEDQIPIVNLSSGGIVRCRRCRAYINPWSIFTDGGRRWKCNLCAYMNDVPTDYYCGVDANGFRTDLHERPELTKGCVEFVASSEYMVRPPQPPGKKSKHRTLQPSSLLSLLRCLPL
jgi:protein transport protein SEC24